VIAVLLNVFAAAAQEATGVLAGTVIDQTNAVLGGAHVELRDDAGVLLQAATSDSAGGFHFDQAPHGGHHLLATGVQIPDWSRRRFDDNSNRMGTFYFADLAAYAAGRPYAFTEQQGDGHVVLLEKVLGLFRRGRALSAKSRSRKPPGISIATVHCVF
jgi:hypothetical protein